MILTFASAQDLASQIGARLGPTDWMQIDQSRIDAFADATEDHQWLHVDPARAADGPYGRTIAHGYLTLSLTNYFLPQLFRAENLDWGVNYGLDRVRFPAPVPVESRMRCTGELIEAQPLDQGVVQTKLRLTVEVEGQAKPGCVADTLQRYAFR